MTTSVRFAEALTTGAASRERIVVEKGRSVGAGIWIGAEKPPFVQSTLVGKVMSVTDEITITS